MKVVLFPRLREWVASAVLLLLALFPNIGLAAAPADGTVSMAGPWTKSAEYCILLSDDGTWSGMRHRSAGKWRWLSKEEKRLEITLKDSTDTVVLAPDGQRVTGQDDKGQPVLDLKGDHRKDWATASGTSGAMATGTPNPSKPMNPLAVAKPDKPAPPATLTTAARTAELVKTYRQSFVFVTGPDSAGSGFLANYGSGVVLFTNAHVAAGVKGATCKTLDGTVLTAGAAACAVGHDVFILQTTAERRPLEIMQGVDEKAGIGDEVVVLGNAEGAGVINTITGKIVGLGPQLVEVDAPFQPGNSGSPIIHLKSGKVIGLATYAMVRKYDSMTHERIKDPVIRRFGYRLDSIKNWQSVKWPTFAAQAVEMESIEKLTADLGGFLDDLTTKGSINIGAHHNPVIKAHLEDWLAARGKGLKQQEVAANRSLLGFLENACEGDVKGAQVRMTYDYFQRGLTDQQKERDEILGIFKEIVGH